MHSGIDVAANAGTPVVASAAGRVVFAGEEGAYGLLVEVEHADNFVTRYAHVERVFRGAGDAVGQGDVIATVGATGQATGPHLHFEILKDGAHVDPRTYVPYEAGVRAPA